MSNASNSAKYLCASKSNPNPNGRQAEKIPCLAKKEPVRISELMTLRNGTPFLADLGDAESQPPVLFAILNSEGVILKTVCYPCLKREAARIREQHGENARIRYRSHAAIEADKQAAEETIAFQTSIADAIIVDDERTTDDESTAAAVAA